MATKLGSELKVGDAIEVWGPRRVRIVKLVPYNNDFAKSVWPEGGVRIAEFDVGSGMTIDPSMRFEVIDLALPA